MSDAIAISIGLVLAAALVLIAALVGRDRRRTAPVHEASADEGLERRLQEVEKSLGKAQHDINNIRFAMGGLATRDHVHSLELQLSDLKGAVNRANDTALATHRSVERMESYLIPAART